MGYHRYWLAEHHNSASIAGSAPEVLMGAIAANTKRIRVGSAGIMLPHYAPLKVAEQFRVLEAIAAGRIDTSLGRAPGADGLTVYALNPNASAAADHFPADVRDRLAWVSGSALDEGHPFGAITAQPAGPGAPEAWILGSSDYGAQVAAHFGLPYCFAYFITEGVGAMEALETYRLAYRPSRRHPSHSQHSAFGRSPPTHRRRRLDCSAVALCRGYSATGMCMRRCPRPMRRLRRNTLQPIWHALNAILPAGFSARAETWRFGSARLGNATR
jgi:luciferase family oxidoreductase group 1